MRTPVNTTMTTLAVEVPAIVGTEQAAAMLNRSPQTLRKWACYGKGGIRPVRINGRLAWHTKDVLALLSYRHSKV